MLELTNKIITIQYSKYKYIYIYIYISVHNSAKVYIY